MGASFLHQWHHFEADIILCAVRWYLRSALSDRDVGKLLRQRGVWVDHTTVFRWVHRDPPELNQRCRPSLRVTHDSYRVNKPYIKIKKQWHDLYRAVDSTGATLDFMLSGTRDAHTAKWFFRKMLDASHTTLRRVITVDKNAAYPLAFDALRLDSTLSETYLLRQCKYLNNFIEQAHRLQQTIQGYEAMHMLHTGRYDPHSPCRGSGSVACRDESSHGGRDRCLDRW